MRVLFASSPALGHAFPMVPLAWALRASGHDVLFATSAGGLQVQRAGLPVADLTPPGFDLDAALEQLKQVRPDLYARMHAVQTERQTDVRDAVDYFGETAGFDTPALLEVAGGWRPDLIVGSFLDGAGLAVAAKLGLPYVRHNADLGRTTGIDELFRHHMAPVFDQLGIDGLPARRVTLDVAPPSAVEVAEDEWPMRCVPYNGSGVLPDWLLPTGDRPRVAVTLGSIVPGYEGLGKAAEIIGAAAEVDADFVVALGEADAAELGTTPANVRIAGWVPLTALLPTCQAIVHHGGGGTTMSALSAGVPQLVVTGGAGRNVNALALAARGAALVPDDGVVTTALIRQALEDETLRKTALDIAAEMATMPSPNEVAGRLVTFATR
ncbi:UDP:flavonoid glycosyltransferase YjiC, YdhE family [Amycolatopsis xylanica]|uniref:UDP:flavonoid glycosyltransferase YjiC, YdhE family n=1 Tax=Amycolatopsis xylanica TaxID=589385 RepID=A0A1H2VUC5_9PSEU|nr:nucleotide disphospho-sugar-binding domain-containing protein [Amycolatopsis xylanica]SDW71439.1 UDP:flavonoid glycosyltransferase YjiC, YdhE family [Amycolatopsis xylanica]